mmetsp:Transcript_486/g.1885  ORF Transcript_486/g.1885 Transcript_486/m.1885 type:complete len:733 (-) Transcript_486:125-2323(-)
MATPPVSPTRPKPKGPNSWNCSYVMSSGDGINLLGTLDVDAKRARFVAATGLFGTAYQFVMPRDQIQVLRVPTAKTPYNALELHTKYRQNILCDFDDNKEVFGRCCEVMKLEILPQDAPLIGVISVEKSEVAKEYRAKTELRKLAASSVERDVSALRSPSSANRRNEDEQLTKQVQHLFTEKAMLQRRLKELERENQHLHDETEMLYTQVDEQADEVDAAYERAMRDAAEVVVEDFLTRQQELDARREAEVAAARAEADAVRERLGKLEADAGREREVRVLVDGAIRNIISGDDDTREPDRRKPDPSPQTPPSTQTPSSSALASPPPPGGTPSSSALTPARERELHALQRRSEELQRHMERMRSERAGMELEVAALRRELFEKEEQTYADRESLAREVEQLLARQAEMSSNLARVRREKEMLEEDNEVLYAKAEEESERARAEAEAEALARTPTTSDPSPPSPLGAARSPDRGGGGVDGPDTPPTAEKATTPPPKPEGDETRRTTRRTAAARGSSSDEEENDENDENDGTRAPPATANATPAGYHSPAHAWRVHSQVSSPDKVRVRAAAAAKKSIADGPDSELAAKLMRRLKRAGEENEAEALSDQVRTLQAEQAEMRRAMAEVEREKERMAEEVARLKEAASPTGGADAFVNPLSPAMGLGSPLVSPFGSDDGVMREREEALSRREMELERELEEMVREVKEATALEVARLREECAAKDARIAELLAAAKA